MTNKYAGRCMMCKGVVDVGAGNLMRGRDGWLVYHPDCMSLLFGRQPEGLQKIRRSEFEGGRMFRIGELLRTHTGEIVLVISRSYRRFRHTGTKHGVGRDEGYMYYADVRAATPKEVARLLAWEAEMGRNTLSGTKRDQNADRDPDSSDVCRGMGIPAATPHS